MDINSEIKKLLDFMIREEPKQAKEILKTIILLKNSLEDSKETLDKSTRELIGDKYSKAKEYMNIAENIPNITKEIENYIESFPIDKEIFENDKRITNDIISLSESCIIDLNNPNEAIGNKPIEFYFDNVPYKVKSWKALYLEVCKLLYQKNPRKFRSFDFRSTKYKWFITEKEYKEEAKKFQNIYELILGTNIYAYKNLSADKIIENIKILFNQYSSISYNDIIIYINKNNDNISENEDFNENLSIEQSNNINSSNLIVYIVKEPMKRCIYCKSKTAPKLYNIETKKQTEKIPKLLMYHCNNCMKYYIFYKTYHNFIRNRQNEKFFTENSQEITFEELK